MKQRAVVLVNDYLWKRLMGRTTRVKQIGEDDYVMAIEDRREGRTHLVRTARDLEQWLESFRQGRCESAAFGFCRVCDGIHRDRDADGEIMRYCLPCAGELIEIAAERYLSDSLDP